MVIPHAWFSLFLSLLLLFGRQATASPTNTKENDETTSIARRSLANGATLRVLCLGASIVHGYESSTNNGFRYALRGALRSSGNPVNMIGSLKVGTMNNNEVEGWSGFRIAEIAKKAELSLPSMPNVVVINAGTNDMAQNFDVAHAHLRMGAMLDRIFEVVPDTAVVVSTLLPNANPATHANVRIYNANLVGVIAERAAAGKKIVLVDMSSNWFSIADLHGDGTHPTDMGYLKMAKVFYNGIVSLGSRITEPHSVSFVNDLAAKDDAGATTALDTICQTGPGQAVRAAQRVQCNLGVAAPSPVPSTSAALNIQIANTAKSSPATPSSTVETSTMTTASSPTSMTTSSGTTNPVPSTISSVNSISSSPSVAISKTSSTLGTSVSAAKVSSSTPTPTQDKKSGSSLGKNINKYLLVGPLLGIGALMYF